MPKQKLRLEHSGKEHAEMYRLVPPKPTIPEYIGQFAWRLITLPYNLYQTVVGRLLSYLVINPLFRKEEKDESLILQHPKFPDPLFEKSDEMGIINVIPKKNILIRALLNWHNFFANHTTTGKVAFSLLSKIVGLFPSGGDYIDGYLDRLVNKVGAKLSAKKGEPLNPNQIHFRGLEQLNDQQKDAFYKKLNDRFNYDFRQNKKNVCFFKLQTPDNAVLDSVEVRGLDAESQDMADRHFIVTSMPRSNNFVDWLKHYQVYAKKLDATIIAFNYRGVGLSKGIVTNEENLFDDAYAQVQRLLALGAKPENIAMMGECLGANVATHTAGRLQSEGLPVKLYNARSFRSLTSIIEARNLPSKDESLWNPLTWLKWAKYGLIKLVLSPIIISAGWSLNVDKEFLQIPPHDRDFLVVRSKKDELGVRFSDDKMIPHKHASIYSLAKEKRAAVLEKQKRGDILSPVDEEWIDDLPKNHKFHVSEKRHEAARKANGHTVHPRLLVETNPGNSKPEEEQVDGRQYTLNFFKRVWPKKQAQRVDAILEESVHRAY